MTRHDLLLLAMQWWPLAAGLLGLWALSPRQAKRAEHWTLPVMAGVYTVVCGYAVMKAHGQSGGNWQWPTGQVLLGSLDLYDLNLAILWLFVAVKAVWVLFAALQRGLAYLKRAMLKQQPAPATLGALAELFYQATPTGQSVLRGRWIAPCMILALFVAIATGLVALMGMDDVLGGERATMALPALASILLLELRLFLGGPQTAEDAADVPAEAAAEPAPRPDFRKLWEECQKLWPEHLLVAGYACPPQDARDHALVNRLAQLLDEGQCVILQRASFAASRSAIEARLLAVVRKRMKVLVLVDGWQALEEAHSWLASITPEPWAVHRFEAGRQAADLREGVNLAESGDFIRSYGRSPVRTDGTALLLFVGERGLVVEGVSAQFISQMSQANSVHGLQIAILAEARLGLESALRTHLPKFARELAPARSYPPSAFFIAWRLEAEGEFQDALFKGYCEVHLGAEAVLALPAWRDGVKAIRFAELDSLPIGEHVEDIDNHRGQLEGGPITNVDLAQRGSLRDAVGHWGSTWQPERPAHAYVLARDNHFNLSLTLDRWMPMASEEVLLHVVSAPYLLRDYLAANAAFFLMTPLLPLTPRVVPSEVPVAEELLEGLTREGGISEDEVSALLRLISSTPDADFVVTHRLCELVHRVYGLDLLKGGLLSLVEMPSFDGAGFKTRTHYCARPSIRHALPSVDTAYRLLDANGALQGQSIAAEHLAQTLLPGQVRVYWREHYRCTQIDERSRQAHVEHVLIEREPIYRPVHAITILEPVNGAVNGSKREQTAGNSGVRRVGRSWIQARIRQLDWKVCTLGYFAFDMAVAPQAPSTQFVSLSEDAEPCKSAAYLRREYVNGLGRALEVRIWPTTGVPASSSAYFALSVLLAEMLPTLFPEGHHLLICTCMSSNRLDPSNLSGTIEDYLNRQCLQTPANMLLADAIYVFEDSRTNMGMLDALETALDYVFALVYDYLFWLAEERTDIALCHKIAGVRGEDWRDDRSDARRDEFLCFGNSSISPLLNLEGVMALLAGMGYDSRRDTLTGQRAAFMKSRLSQPAEVKQETAQTAALDETPTPEREQSAAQEALT